MAEEIEETYEEPVAKIPITVSLEPCKSKFFGDDLDGFKSELTNGKFKVFTSNYKYSDDYDGRPSFIINNLLNGFVKQLEDKRKYLFVGFRATKTDNKYTITGAWITNCTVPMADVVLDKYEDFNWTDVDVTNANDVTIVLQILDRTKDDNVLTSYLH